MAQIHLGWRKYRLVFGSLVFIITLVLMSACGAAGGKTEGGMEKHLPLTEELFSSFIEVVTQYPDGALAFPEQSGLFQGPRLRTGIITFQFAEKNRIYFCTNSGKSWYQSLKKNPAVSYCTYAEDFEPVLSFNGKVVFVEDMALKARLIESKPHLKRIYETPENPVFKVFYINVENIETYGSDGAVIYEAGRDERLPE
ncbi:MAG: hypothetical protein LBK27_04845 [Treponema sp.]|jgi:uncharacterized pyridoxamine 5'-phosphate oxidase family protein|nr:hypothetical protein [Treponema sp.]